LTPFSLCLDKRGSGDDLVTLTCRKRLHVSSRCLKNGDRFGRHLSASTPIPRSLSRAQVRRELSVPVPTPAMAERPDPSSPEAYARTTAIYGSFVARFGNLAVPDDRRRSRRRVGAGLNLALSTYPRIVATNALLRSSSFGSGIPPGGVSLSTLAGRSAVGSDRSAGLCTRTVGRAGRPLGLAWEAVPDEAVETGRMDLAATAATDPPGSPPSHTTPPTPTRPPQTRPNTPPPGSPELESSGLFRRGCRHVPRGGGPPGSWPARWRWNRRLAIC